METKKNTQARRHLLTINNPADKGYTSEVIVDKLEKCMPQYYCFAREIGSEGTEHIHIYLHTASPIRFSTLQGRFPGAYIDIALGSANENRDYVAKTGKWEDTDKADTVIDGSFREWGCIPPDVQNAKEKNQWLLNCISQGMTDAEILKADPGMITRLPAIARARQAITADQQRTVYRDVTVYYLWGPEYIDLTRIVLDKHGPDQVCRINAYRPNNVCFDSYTTEPVIMLDNYFGQLPYDLLMNVLSGFPNTMLPARYADKVAAYNTVYILAREPIDALYGDTKLGLTVRAKIDYVCEVTADGEIITKPCKEGKDDGKEQC